MGGFNRPFAIKFLIIRSFLYSFCPRWDRKTVDDWEGVVVEGKIVFFMMLGVN